MKRNIAIGLLLVSMAIFFISLNQLHSFAEENKEVDSFSTIQSKSSKTYNDKQTPAILEIPDLSIKATVVPVGVTKKGAMAAPKGLIDVGWYKFGPIPGQSGSSVIAGHVDNALSLDGVFKQLGALQVGADVYTITKEGQKMHFKVVEVKTYDYDKAPIASIFHSNDVSRLNLITCTGVWDKLLKTYNKRLVVYTTLVSIE